LSIFLNQGNKGGEKTFSFTETHPKFKADIADCLNKTIAVDKGVAIFFLLTSPPFFDHFRLNPKMDLASIYQLFVILFPITFYAHGFCLDVLSLRSLNSWAFHFILFFLNLFLGVMQHTLVIALSQAPNNAQELSENELEKLAAGWCMISQQDRLIGEENL